MDNTPFACINRVCINCGGPIPAARLAAIPGATRCVPCLTLAGDVPVWKRFDEPGPDGEVVETFFTDDKRLLRQVTYTNNVIADAAAFAAAVGDDAELTVEIGTSLDIARSLAEDFEHEEEFALAA